jgi:MSHA biogenesis protein MshG
MPQYAFTALAAGGNRQAGNIVAQDYSDAALRLEAGGLLPITITARESREVSISDWLRRLGFGRPANSDLVMFTRQMYTIAKSGLPWLRGLRGLVRNTRNTRLRAALERAVQSLEGGRELSQALGEGDDIFPELYLGMIAVGEQTGTLDNVFLKLSDYLQNQQDLRERVAGAMRYPLIVMAAIVAAVAVLSTFVIPKFAPMFKQLGHLPLPTRVLLASSSFVQAHWLALLVGVAAAGVTFSFVTRGGAGRYHWHRLRLRLPIFGELLRQSVLARALGTLSLTLSSGLPMMQALDLIARSADNDYLQARIRDMRRQLESGEPLSSAAEAVRIFPPLAIQMMEVGEETGELPRLLDEIADFYRRDVDYTLKNLGSLIEPLMMVVIGGLVLLMALGIFLPLWEMIGKVAGG